MGGGLAYKLLCSVSHFLAGLLSSLAVAVSPVLTVVGFLVFLIYELDEEWKLEDYAYEEIREYGAGFFLGVAILLAITVLANV
jgi:hypothetical protein